MKRALIVAAVLFSAACEFQQAPTAPTEVVAVPPPVATPAALASHPTSMLAAPGQPSLAAGLPSEGAVDFPFYVMLDPYPLTKVICLGKSLTFYLKVVDSKDLPVEGVLILTGTQVWVGVTPSDGRVNFTYEPLEPGTQHLMFNGSKDGYTSGVDYELTVKACPYKVTLKYEGAWQGVMEGGRFTTSETATFAETQVQADEGGHYSGSGGYTMNITRTVSAEHFSESIVSDARSTIDITGQLTKDQLSLALTYVPTTVTDTVTIVTDEGTWTQTVQSDPTPVDPFGVPTISAAPTGGTESRPVLQCRGWADPAACAGGSGAVTIGVVLVDEDEGPIIAAR